MAAEEMIPFAAAIAVVHNHRGGTRGEAEAFLRAAIARGEIRIAPDAQLAARLKSVAEEKSRYNRPPQGVEPDLAMDILGRAATEACLNAAVADAPLIRKADLLNLLNQQASSTLTLAPRSVIEKVITEIYDDADKGADRPNINQLPKVALPKLKALGFRASGRQIKDIGSDEKFANRRGEPGRHS
jgi:hypothetical protein